MTFQQKEADFAPLPVPGTIMRRNPRDERGRRRRVPLRARATSPAPEEAVIVEDADTWIAVVVMDADNGLTQAGRDLLATARCLAGDGGGVLAIVSDRQDHALLASELAIAGADRLVLVAAASGTPEREAQCIGEVTEAFGARQVLFGNDPISGDLARRLAIGFKQMPASRVRHLTKQTVICEFDGSARELQMQPPRVILLAPDFPCPEAEGRLREARILRHGDGIPEAPSAWSIGETVAPSASTMPLRDADFVVSGGAGVSDWSTLRTLAERLDAAIGGSRVVCDNGLLPRDRQIGASGLQVTARTYLAFGISGAPQHLEGIQACQHVISVNTDPKANIVSRADLSICADAKAVMSAMLRKLEVANG